MRASFKYKCLHLIKKMQLTFNKVYNKLYKLTDWDLSQINAPRTGYYDSFSECLQYNVYVYWRAEC